MDLSKSSLRRRNAPSSRYFCIIQTSDDILHGFLHGIQKYRRLVTVRYWIVLPFVLVVTLRKLETYKETIKEKSTILPYSIHKRIHVRPLRNLIQGIPGHPCQCRCQCPSYLYLYSYSYSYGNASLLTVSKSTRTVHLRVHSFRTRRLMYVRAGPLQSSSSTRTLAYTTCDDGSLKMYE